MLGANHHREARAVDVLVQQADEPLLFFDHQQERLERAERQALVFVEQRGGSVHVERPLLGQISKGRRGEPHRASHQRIVEQALLLHPLANGLARQGQRQPRKLRI